MAEAPLRRRTVRRDGVLVEGADSRAWLQGQLSQDIEPLAAGESCLSLVLSPQGKLDSFCRVTRLSEQGYLLDTEPGYGAALAERLRRFKLRVKVTLGEVGVVCEEEAGRGYDSLGPPRLAAEGESVPEPADEEAFEAERIAAGLPRLGRELTERTIAQEAGEEFVARTVSFTKGCYTGQELVARLDARGANVPRRLRLLVGDPASALPAPAASVRRQGEEVGQLTSVARRHGSWVGLAYLKRAALSPDPVPVEVTLEDGSLLPAVALVPGEAP